MPETFGDHVREGRNVLLSSYGKAHRESLRRLGGMCAISALCALWVECAP